MESYLLRLQVFRCFGNLNLELRGDLRMYLFWYFQLNVCPKYQCISTVAKRTDLFKRDVNKVLLTDFFGSVRNVELLPESIQLQNITLSTERYD